ncbi:GGDEF and EAL domain-containing protein [Ancylobacter sp. MQZ15Z-1]|uniref:GGDEF and EAL domain-containing protein n=1 Tax=Ancylobacter mangrovi TaxID=2972472 RepID=A0A9X2PES5_9HYPH|nr:GGDEF and EAL domain-containing protein [Ancylobacter mangrovi]MCS0497354.1 GGDEF and EAL domain-containing protein [Ancylobacter mangrovi]
MSENGSPNPSAGQKTRSPEIGPTEELPPETVADILRGLEGVAYRWTLEDDRVTWSSCAAGLLGPERLAWSLSGRDFARLIATGSGASRFEAAHVAAPAHSPGAARFETSYCLDLPPDTELGRLWVEDRGIGHFDAEGRLVRVDGLLRRLSSGRPVRDGAEGALAVQPDRQRLATLLEQNLVRVLGEGGEFGFALIGLDHLGQLNDAYGFHTADEVIDIMFMRLRARIEPSDELARFSGSKFGLIVRGRPMDGFVGALEQIVASVNATPPRTSAGAVAASVTAGGLIAPRQARSVEEIFARAQDALHSAREAVRGGVELYAPSFDRAAERRANLHFADDIVSALADRRVSLAFQPIAEGKSRRIAFHECLVRITGRDGQVFDGAAIIPAADRFGLTRLLDRRSLELALAALTDDPELRLSVNVSPATIHDGVWLELMEEGAQAGLAERVIVELTESATIADIEAMRRRVHWLHSLGAQVAMDDFGAGYTSFRNLRRLDVDYLKIDGSFICTMMQSADDRHFVRSLLELAGNLGIETVAEWVIDEATGRQLVDWGCTYLQGELIGLASERPIPNPPPAN